MQDAGETSGLAGAGRTAEKTAYREHIFHAADDLALYYRDYGGAGDAVPLLCLGGLTRNSRDFHKLACRLSAKRRVLTMDYRGRGRSAYDPDWHHYTPQTYVADAIELLRVADAGAVAVIGTSLGGLCAMGLAAAVPARLKGVVLNDIGPKVNRDGLARIAAYVGQEVRLQSLDQAAAALARQFAGAYPDATPELWRDMAEGTFAFDAAAGDWRLDYDLALGNAVREQATQEAPDLWPLYKALEKIPTLAVRGALSDVLDAATFDRMAAEKPDLERLLIPNCGHVPIPHLEPMASAIETFLDRL